jgi:DNA-binding transcriptional LysR family regulator
MTQLEWDDLRYVLAVATSGSLAGAARNLGVNHTTVLRRIGAFEQRLGLRLFERLPTGYVLTAGGEELITAARHIDDTVTALERKLAGQDLRLSGVLRITTTDTLMGSILPEILAEFRDSHPGIAIEVAISNLMFNLTRRDADVAIRPAPLWILTHEDLKNVARIRAFTDFAAKAFKQRRSVLEGAKARGR